MKRLMARLFRVFDSATLNVLFWAVVLMLAFSVIHNACFILGDDQYYIDNICQGRPMSFHVVKSAGRFTPFTHVDLNLLLLLPAFLRPDIALCSYVVNALLLMIGCWLFVKLAKAMMPENRGFFAEMIVLLSLGFFLGARELLYVFWWDVFPECRMVFLELTFLVLAMKGVQGGKSCPLVLSVVPAVLMTMYKETSFILVSGVAGGVLALGWRKISQQTRVWCLLVLTIMLGYCLMYYFCIYRHMTGAYHADRMLRFSEAFRFYFGHPVAGALLVLGAVRAIFAVSGRSREHFLADAFLFAGLLFSCAYVILGLCYHYFLVPAYVLFAASVAHWLGVGHVLRPRLSVLLAGAFMLAAVAPSWCLARAFWQYVQDRRLSEPTVARLIASGPAGGQVLYYYPKEGVEENYYRENLRRFVEFEGGKAPTILMVRELPGRLSEGQLLVVPRLWSVPDHFQRFVCGCNGNVIKIDWFYVVFGPVDLARE